MKWDALDEEPCPIARSLAVLGDRWTLMIIRDAFFGVRRFEAFQASLRISRTSLSERLQTLVDARVLERIAYSERPVRYEYRLTRRGKELHDVMLLLARWGNSIAEAPITETVHATCGHVLTPVLTCADCGEPVRPRDVRVRRLAQPQTSSGT